MNRCYLPLLALLACCATQGQLTGTSSRSRSDRDVGSLQVYVCGPDAGPLSGSFVEVSREHPPWRVQGTSNSEGAVGFAGLPFGKYGVEVRSAAGLATYVEKELQGPEAVVTVLLESRVLEVATPDESGVGRSRRKVFSKWLGPPTLVSVITSPAFAPEVLIGIRSAEAGGAVAFAAHSSFQVDRALSKEAQLARAQNDSERAWLTRYPDPTAITAQESARPISREVADLVVCTWKLALAAARPRPAAGMPMILDGTSYTFALSDMGLAPQATSWEKSSPTLEFGPRTRVLGLTHSLHEYADGHIDLLTFEGDVRQQADPGCSAQGGRGPG